MAYSAISLFPFSLETPLDVLVLTTDGRAYLFFSFSFETLQCSDGNVNIVADTDFSFSFETLRYHLGVSHATVH